MSGDADLLKPTTETPPPVADAAPPVIEVVKPPVDDDSEPEGIEAPDGEKYVQLSAVTSARAKAKELRTELEAVKAEVGKSAEKDARIAELQQQLQESQPLAQAYRAALDAQARQPQEPAKPTPEQNAKLERVAKSLDYFKSDGTLDLDRAASHLELVRAEAAEIAAQQVAPFQQQSIADKSFHMLQRALVTKGPDGSRPDPDVIREVWKRLDPRITADADGAAQAFSVAMGHSVLLGKTGTAKAKEEIPPPLEIEKAGGKDVGPVTLRDSDRRIARDMGLTDKQYAETLAEMPAGWGKGA